RQRVRTVGGGDAPAAHAVPLEQVFELTQRASVPFALDEVAGGKLRTCQLVAADVADAGDVGDVRDLLQRPEGRGLVEVSAPPVRGHAQGVHDAQSGVGGDLEQRVDQNETGQQDAVGDRLRCLVGVHDDGDRI